jgi:hypothetical protein
MGIIDTITRAQDTQHVDEFIKLAKLITYHRGDALAATRHAETARAAPRIIEILKAAAAAGSLINWADIAPYKILSQAFSLSLRTASVFDAILPHMTPAPLRSRGVTVTTGIVGSIPAEQAVKPIPRLSLGSALVDPVKASAIVVATAELFNLALPEADALFNTELKLAVAAATDKRFLADLLTQSTPTASAGTGFSNIMKDLATLTTAVTSRPTSELFLILDVTQAKKFALSSPGAPAFPGLGIHGGPIMPNLTLLSSDQMPTGNALMIAADGIAGSADIVELDASRLTSLQFSDAPDSPPLATSVPTSLWQTNEKALRCERYFGYVVTRATALASLSGVNY